MDLLAKVNLQIQMYKINWTGSSYPGESSVQVFRILNYKEDEEQTSTRSILQLQFDL